MPTLLKFKSKLLRGSLLGVAEAGRDRILIISASELSVYPSDHDEKLIVSFSIKPDGAASDSSDTSGRPTAMLLDQQKLAMIPKFLDSDSDENDTVIIEVSEEPKVIAFQIENKPGPQLKLSYDVVDFELGRAMEKDSDATLTLSRSDFLKGCVVLADAIGEGPTTLVNISVTVEGIKFSARNHSVMYKPNEVVSWNMRNPVSFNLQAEYLSDILMTNLRSESVTISAFPSIPLRLEFNIEDTLYWRYDILQQPEIDALGLLSAVIPFMSKRKRDVIRRDLAGLGLNVDPFRSPPRDD